MYCRWLQNQLIEGGHQDKWSFRDGFLGLVTFFYMKCGRFPLLYYILGVVFMGKRLHPTDEAPA